MMTEEEIKQQVEILEKHRVDVLSELNATEGALQAYRYVLKIPQQQPPAPPNAPQP